MNLQSLTTKFQSIFGAALAFGYGVYDAGWGHAFSKDLDLGLILAGLSVLGVTVAYHAGLNSDPVPPKTS